MPYWPIGLWFWGFAFSMGWVMAPSTASVMGSVPREKSGVASAMNDVSRQVAGALGTAIVGSLISSLYATRMHDHATSLPAASQTAAEESIGQANAVAATLPTAEAASLADAAASAFTDAMGIAFAVTAVFALAGAIAVGACSPRASRSSTTLRRSTASRSSPPDDGRSMGRVDARQTEHEQGLPETGRPCFFVPAYP